MEPPEGTSEPGKDNHQLHPQRHPTKANGIAMSTRPLFLIGLLAGFLCVASSPVGALADVVKWRNSIDTAKIEAAQTNKLVLVHFWTPSCGPCRQLDSNVFSQPQIGQLLEQNFVPVKINADQSPAIAGSFTIDRVPTDVVLTPQGNVVAKLACPPTPEGYGTQLLNLNQHYRQQTAARATPAQAPLQSAYAGLQVGQYNNAQVATTPNYSQQVNPMNQAPAGQAGGAVSTPAAAGPQVTYNTYAMSSENQRPGLAASPAIPRYENQQTATMVPQPTHGTTTSAVQTTYAQAGPQGSQQVASVAPNIAGTVAPAIKLPAGSPPLAFEGYCPATLKHARKWVLGDPAYGAIHRGRTYLFTGEEQRQQFLASPDEYSPVFSGIDPVKLLDENKTVEGSRKFGYEYRGAFYLFSSQESMSRFASQPDLYAAGVRQAMLRMDGTAGDGTIRR